MKTFARMRVIISLTICVGCLLSGLAFGQVYQSPMSGVYSAGVTTGPRQNTDRIFKKSSFTDEPIRIVKVKNKSRQILLGKKFNDDADDWLRGLTITIENLSERTITHLSFTLFFPRAGGALIDQGLPYSFDMVFGVSPSSEHYAESRRRFSGRIIRHGGVHDLALSDEQFDHIRKVLNSLGYSQGIREVEIWINEVGFEDGSRWVGGEYLSVMNSPVRQSAA
jgi:hypothetical protein